MTDDPILLHLDIIARLLEAAGYGVEVDYAAATIIVWAENWPVHLSVLSHRWSAAGEELPTTDN